MAQEPIKFTNQPNTFGKHSAIEPKDNQETLYIVYYCDGQLSRTHFIFKTYSTDQQISPEGHTLEQISGKDSLLIRPGQARLYSVKNQNVKIVHAYPPSLDQLKIKRSSEKSPLLYKDPIDSIKEKMIELYTSIFDKIYEDVQKFKPTTARISILTFDPDYDFNLHKASAFAMQKCANITVRESKYKNTLPQIEIFFPYDHNDEKYTLLTKYFTSPTNKLELDIDDARVSAKKGCCTLT